MNIETKWLEDFLSLAKTQNFSRSAEERHLTQPAFSRRIKALEDALGCALIDRTNVPVQLTEEGILFQVTARNLVSQLRDCISHLQSMGQRGKDIIDFAVSHTLSLSLFPTFLKSLQPELGEVGTRQLVANVDDSTQVLKNGLSDFLLAFEDNSLATEEFDMLELQDEQLMPVCKSDDNGAPLFTLDAANNGDQPYLAYPDDIYLGRCVALLLKKPPVQINLHQVFESPMADSLKVMAQQGNGIAWVPTFAISSELEQGSLVPCGGAQWSIPLKICLYRSKRTLSPVAERLWQVLELRCNTAVETSSTEK